MRSLVVALALAFAVAGCSDDAPPIPDAIAFCEWNGVQHEVGEVFPDDCNSCMCFEDGQVQCTQIACPPPGSCLPFQSCENGPRCGDGCCERGHACVEGECQCGDGPACGVGDICEANGPVGKDACGAVCCGISGPCPQ